MRNSLMAGASRFASLRGLRGARRAEDEDRDEDKTSKRSRRAADDDDKEDKTSKRSRAEDDDKDEEPKGKRSRASDDEDDEPKGKRSRRADDEDDKDDEPKGKRSRASDDEDDYVEDDEDDKKDSKRSRRARAEDDDEDDDKDEMSGRSAAANARRRERARCSAIFDHPAAADNVALAASLAFETSMTRKEAIAVLKGQAGRGGSSAHDVRADRDDRRSRNNPDLGVGGDAPKGAAAVTNLWDRAIKSVGVTPRK